MIDEFREDDNGVSFDGLLGAAGRGSDHGASGDDGRGGHDGIGGSRADWRGSASAMTSRDGRPVNDGASASRGGVPGHGGVTHGVVGAAGAGVGGPVASGDGSGSYRQGGAAGAHTGGVPWNGGKGTDVPSGGAGGASASRGGVPGHGAVHGDAMGAGVGMSARGGAHDGVYRPVDAMGNPVAGGARPVRGAGRSDVPVRGVLSPVASPVVGDGAVPVRPVRGVGGARGDGMSSYGSSRGSVAHGVHDGESVGDAGHGPAGDGARGAVAGRQVDAGGRMSHHSVSTYRDDGASGHGDGSRGVRGVVPNPAVRARRGSGHDGGGASVSHGDSGAVPQVRRVVHPDVPVRRVPSSVGVGGVPADGVAPQRGRVSGDSNASHDASRAHASVSVPSSGGSVRTRGKDRHKRATRSRIGDVDLSRQQSRLVDRVNRNRRGDGAGKAFVYTDTDQRVFDYLVRWRFATRLDVLRVGGWRGFYGRKSYRLNEYRDLGFANVDRIPLERLTYAQLTSSGVALSRYDYLGAEPMTAISSGTRSHSLGLSSLASQLLAVDEEYDDVSHDLLGLGDEWGRLREDIRKGDAKVIAEREYRSALARLRKGMSSASALTDPDARGAMLRMFKEEREANHGVLTGDLYDWSCCDPQYQGQYAWLWAVFGNWVVRDVERNSHGRPRLVDVGQRAVDDRGKPVLIPGDRFATKDHLPDMVIARHRNHDGSPNSLAIELELTAKSEEDYDQTMCGFMSSTGKILYQQVVWLVVQGATANLIRRGAARAGAVEGIDYRVVAVSSSDTRSSFYNGADMRPGVLDVYDSGEARGYSKISEIMGSGSSRSGEVVR